MIETLLGDSDGVNTFSLDEDVENIIELFDESSMKMFETIEPDFLKSLSFTQLPQTVLSLIEENVASDLASSKEDSSLDKTYNFFSEDVSISIFFVS